MIMGGDEDPVLEALAAVEVAVAANSAANQAIRRRAKQLRAARARGRSWAEIVEKEERPIIVELLRANQERLSLTGSAFRRAQAAALRREGLTLDEIARQFGVTRPRIVALLRDAADEAARAGAGAARVTKRPTGRRPSDAGAPAGDGRARRGASPAPG